LGPGGATENPGIHEAKQGAAETIVVEPDTIPMPGFDGKVKVKDPHTGRFKEKLKPSDFDQFCKGKGR
jgi:hypothetical protein